MVLSYFFHPCSVDLLVFDLHGTHCLNKVRVFPADMDSGSHFEFAISDFNSAHAQTGKEERSSGPLLASHHSASYFNDGGGLCLLACY